VHQHIADHDELLVATVPGQQVGDRQALAEPGVRQAWALARNRHRCRCQRPVIV